MKPTDQSSTTVQAGGILPVDRVVAGVLGFQPVADFVEAGEHGAQDEVGFGLILEFGVFVVPDHRQPLIRLDRIGPDREAGQEAVELGQVHAGLRRTRGIQEIAQGLEVDGVVFRKHHERHRSMGPPPDGRARRGNGSI